jgi:hypothetical protein
VSRPSEEDRWQRSRDLANSGVRRVKAQVLGVQSREARGREATKWREDRSHPSEEDRWREIEGSRELGSSQVESPTFGYSKSRGREVAREGEPLDPEHRRTVGSERGIVSRDLARKGSRIWPRGSRGCEIAISRQLESSVGHSGVQVEYRWHKGFVSREVPRSETRVDASHEAPRSRDSCGRVAEHKVGPRISGTRGLGG